MTFSVLFQSADICTAFEGRCIGSKVTNTSRFLDLLEEAVERHDTSKDRVPGQMFLKLPEEANQYVSCGVGLSSPDESAYCLRSYRGKVSAFLLRQYALPTTSVAVVLYTLDAALNDPDATEEENERLKRINPKYVVVAVLASSGAPPQLSPHRFTANLAGGNHEAQVWTADEIRQKAKDIMSADHFVAVADR